MTVPAVKVFSEAPEYVLFVATEVVAEGDDEESLPPDVELPPLLSLEPEEPIAKEMADVRRSLSLSATDSSLLLLSPDELLGAAGADTAAGAAETDEGI